MPAAGSLDLYLFDDDDGARGAVTYDTRFEDTPAREGYAHERRVVLAPPEPTDEHLLPSGLPRDGLLARWREAERDLLAALDDAGARYVKAGHVAIRASYTVVLELADANGFAAVVEAWQAAADRGRVDVVASDGWSYFDAHVKPRGASRYWSANAKLVEQLRGAGLEPSSRPAAEYRFEGEALAALETALRRLLEGETIAVTTSDGAMTLTTSAVLEPFAASERDHAFHTLAAQHEALYDGWGVATREKTRGGAQKARGESAGREALREAAATTITKLGLSGYDNASIDRVDAWLGSEECSARTKETDGEAAIVGELGAYLGEAIIRRHGGKWDFSGDWPRVAIKRNGFHLVDPLGKVKKRIVNGKEDDLLALVNLVQRVASVESKAERRERTLPLPTAAPAGGGTSVTKFLFWTVLVLVVASFVVTALVMAALKAC